MPGIQLHPHDIVDEGMPQIISYMKKLQDVRYVFPEVNTIFERNPYPVGILPRNPVHEVVYGTGTMHAILPSYENAGLDQRREPGLSADRDPLMIIKDAMRDEPFEVIPWLNILNGHFEGPLLANNLVTDVDGNVIPHWLCPNAPDVIDFWEKAFVDLYQRYGFATYMIDRIRYPDWAGQEVNPKGLLTCFCSHCQSKMTGQGLDVKAIKESLRTFAAQLKDKHFDDAVAYFGQNTHIRSWIAFRQESVSGFVERLIARVRKVNDAFAIWLDLWPPAYSWMLGQNYASITKLSPALKHFPYHKLGGGADVQGLIEYVAHTEEEREAAFRAFKTFFSLPYDVSYETFKAEGFPIRFVADQNNLVRELSDSRTRIFSGIQMWNLTPDNLIEAVKAGENSAADDLLYYCYGWAADELFDAIQRHREKGTN
ncbi:MULTISPECIES: hypothetical protein [unclassified Paenibacillus]|uniref:hypothetical protein n=1 Tax=unclassified Paenibacillus TaxID=185978 RepID=UPI001C116F82|nr:MULTISPECIES: hypothetical protein [unclassified Paenibacillus]MBU5442729.1 hypothetical protein [Paenibacillus sp. MSJ-34]CAH0120953.1 hypothetical protein PAE9249_03478 [Paenibacillus sp. CECT 9249]